MASLKNPRLEFQLDDSEMLENNYSLLKLMIINSGELVAKDISIKLLTEIETVKNLKLEANQVDFPRILGEIKPGEKKEITFGFHPTTAGRASMTILNSCKTAEGKCLMEKKDVLYVTIKPEIGWESTRVQKYRVVCAQAIKDGRITPEERDILDTQARELFLSESEKRQVENEIFGVKNIETVDFERYRKQITAIYNKGMNITDSERGMLDVLRICCNLTKEQQKQIENEIINKQKEDYTIPGSIEITSSDTSKKFILKRKEGVLEITVIGQAKGQIFAGIPVIAVKKGTNQVLEFISDSSGMIKQRVAVGDYTLKIKPSASQLYEASEKQVNVPENRLMPVTLDLRFSYMPINQTITEIKKHYEKLNNSFKEVSAYDRCIPLFFKNTGEIPLKLIERIITRPVEFLGSRTTPDEIINHILSAEEIISEEISRIMREKSNVDFYCSIQNLPVVEEVPVSDYSRDKFNELVHDISNYHKNHFREIGIKLYDIDNELTLLSQALTVHPVADLWGVAQKLQENCFDEPDVKKRGVILFIIDKLLDHVKEMYCREDVRDRLKFTSPNETPEIINRTKKLIDEAKNLGLTISEDDLDDAKSLLSKSYTKALFKVRKFESHVEKLLDNEKTSIEERRKNAEASIDNLNSCLEELRKLSLNAPEINEVMAAYEAKDYNRATEAANAIKIKLEGVIISTRPSLIPKLQITNFKPGTARKTQIMVSNNNHTPAKNLCIDISGDLIFRVLSKPELLRLNPGESKPIDVWIKPTAEGDLPLNILMKYNDGLERSYEDKVE